MLKQRGLLRSEVDDDDDDDDECTEGYYRLECDVVQPDRRKVLFPSSEAKW
jgi:hypothetical protein